MKHLVLVFGFLVVITGCRPKPEYSSDFNVRHDTAIVSFAKGFSIEHLHDTLHIVVRNPWQHANDVEYNYYLGINVVDSLINEYTWQIHTPVKRVVCLSTTHIGFIDFLNQTGTVYGISGEGYVVNKNIRAGIQNQKIFDVGYDENLNYEMILQLNPDIVFAYGVSGSVTNVLKKLNELGIPVMMIAEYLEQNPLAKMEWIKVFSACYAMNEKAAIEFDSIASQYTRLKALAASEKRQPSVLLGLPWRGSWYVSGAQSYVARLIADAGGKYIWDDLNFNESRPMGLEKIYEKALSAEYWINPGEARSIDDIVEVDQRFGFLPAIKNDKVFNNDHQLTLSGGNDFYEAGVVEPHIILSDLICILHPQLLPSHKLKYYRKLPR